MFRPWWIAASLTLSLAVAWSAPARADTVRMATLASDVSPWGQVLKVWAQNVEQQSSGRLHVDWSWGGTAGDERTMVTSIKGGALDGGLLTSDGLTVLARDLLVFQVPGAFASWAKLDAARAAVEGAAEAKLLASGVSLLGWADVGEAKIMSAGFPVRGPSTMAQGTLAWLRGDPVGDAFLSAVGNPPSRRLSTPEFFPALAAHSVQIVDAPPLAAEQLQWSGWLTNVNSMTTHFAVGTLVVSRAALKRLPEDLRTILVTTGREAAQRLTTRIRGLDAQAFARLKNSKTPYDPTNAEIADWSNRFAQCRAQLRGRFIDTTFFDAVMAAAR